MKDILTLCRGLPSNDGIVVTDCDEEPWKSIKPSVRPSNDMLRSEVLRRWQLYFSSEIQPRNKSWTIAQCNAWLDAHPIPIPADMAYLQALYLRRYTDAVAAAQEAVAERQLLSSGVGRVTTRGSPWTIKEAYLRLIHCLLDFDHIRSLFLHCNAHSRTRMELDGRNAEDHPPTVWEEIAEKWNDPSFVVETIMFNIHEDFRTTYIITHDDVAALMPATPDSVKEKITNMMVNLGRIIGRWERSGQGDGGFEPEDDDEDYVPQFGSFHDRTHGALASRSAFLRDRPPYLLYLWELLNENDLLQNAIAQIDPSIAGPNGADGVPSVVGSSKKKRKKADDIGLQVLANSVTLLANRHESSAKIEANMSKMNNLTNVYLTTKIERSKLQLQLCNPDVFAIDSTANMLQQQIDQRYEEMSDLKRQILECGEVAAALEAGN